MKLVAVEFVLLQRMILDRPLLHGSLSDRNGRSSIRVEDHFGLLLHVHKKLCRLVFVEEHQPPCCNGRGCQACETLLVGIQSGEGTYAVIACWFVVVRGE